MRCAVVCENGITDDFIIYVRQGIRSLDLMKGVAESCGAMRVGTVDRILRNLRFDLSQRKVLLLFDEAQHLSIECLRPCGNC